MAHFLHKKWPDAVYISTHFIYMIKGYTIGKKLGSGANAVVYEATKGRKKYAMKFIRETSDAIDREIRIHKRAMVLGCAPRIIEDFIKVRLKKQNYARALVMEKISTFKREITRQQQIDIMRNTWILLENGIIHNDMHQGNIGLLNQRGIIFDFGEAEEIDPPTNKVILRQLFICQLYALITSKGCNTSNQIELCGEQPIHDAIYYVRGHKPEGLEQLNELLGDEIDPCVRWNTDTDYEIVNMMKVFMGENEGRKVVFDHYAKNKFIMQEQHSIFVDFERFLSTEMSSWKRKKTKKPLLLVITYKNHYTGIRIETNGAVTLFDPNHNNKLYTPITLKMKSAIHEVTGSYPVDYTETCQMTHDEADSFCQTWSLILLTHPDFKPHEEIKDRFRVILELYKTLLTKQHDAYLKFVKEQKVSGSASLTITEYMSLADFTLDRFIASLYETKEAFDNRGYQSLRAPDNRGYQSLRLRF